MNKLLYPIINTSALIFTLFINYLSNTGAFNGKTIGELSNELDTLFTPAGYAFTIWGLIYLFQISLVVNQWLLYRKKAYDALLITGFSLALVNLLNAAWVMAWLSSYVGISVLVMLSMLLLLTNIFRRSVTRIDRRDSREVWLIHFPVAIYLGWIILAFVANTSAYLVSISFQSLLTPEAWTLIVITIAVAVDLFLIYRFDSVTPALVGVWGLLAIYVNQWNQQNVVAIYAGIFAGLLLLVALVRFIRSDTPRVKAL